MDAQGMPRYHPLIMRTGWHICDGHTDTEHSLARPHPDYPDPCESYDEALELCGILNADE